MTSSQKIIRFGIIGCGLMGREFASAVARWCHLLDMRARPEIIAISDINPQLFSWYTENFPHIKQATGDYRELLANKEVDAVYCAVPHHLHEKIYCDVLAAGKHLFGEKPFGIDQQQNQAIFQAIKKHPELLVRCSSEMPFYPGAQRIIKAVKQEDIGKIIEVESGFLHSSDLNPNKALNWKRQVEINGEYGCMGDLGMHVFHVPLRLGFQPASVYAQLSKLVKERPDSKGIMQPCLTWDNATLATTVHWQDQTFPVHYKTWRMAPGETDTWYVKILGTRKSFYFSTKSPRQLQSMDYEVGGPQVWKIEDLGYESLFPAITGGIFEFGFTDAILQMWAAFIDELAGGDARGFSCVTPEEARQHHAILTAALTSHKNNQVVQINYEK